MAIKELQEKDLFLIRHGVHEGSVSHKLGGYIGELFPDYDVDGEYNKMSKDGRIVTKRSSNGTRVRPDIIVHGQGYHEDNLLVVEVKKKSNRDPKGRAKDWKELEDLTNVGGLFHYCYGLFVDVDNETGAVDKTYVVNSQRQPTVTVRLSPDF